MTATPHSALPAQALLAPTSSVRPAREGDAAALSELCQPFVRSGALRERPASVYVTRVADFLVAEVPGGALEGCMGLRVHPAGSGEGRGSVGVLYNFCVAGHRQGHGVGAALLRTAMSVARARSLGALFTATTGGGGLFLRYGFAPTTARLAPPSWVESLDPRRNARILAKIL
ncbi:GNAT family N-acetyltransferase [Streptomyces sp. 150FB]|uniref:GNAT family N-acetyltransferase n=1 Tax=Streptomyces sp. 150FB TaxID=1576605 RepID=UPI000D1463A7|nr:GNAT family N-acetyltransferase [Streptomyces sp. 150FB]